MIEYPKIETLYDRDEHFRVIVGKWRLPEFEYLANDQWVWSEKVDGTNTRVIWDGRRVMFAGKTDDAQVPASLLRQLRELFTEEGLSAVFSGPACLYGEGYGAKIQKGGGNYKRDGADFALIDVLIDRWWLERESLEDIASKLHIIPVPIIGRGTLQEATEVVRKGIASQWGPFQAEGIVLRPAVSLFTRKGERVMAKLKTKDFAGGRERG